MTQNLVSPNITSPYCIHPISTIKGSPHAKKSRKVLMILNTVTVNLVWAGAVEKSERSDVDPLGATEQEGKK